MKPEFDWIKTPLKKYTFSIAPIKDWVEKNCEGYTLNLFAGFVELDANEVRNDIDEQAISLYHKDALEFVKIWEGANFDTILLDPPYSYRKSMEKYNGNISSPFKQLKNEVSSILNEGGIVITFGYQSVAMGKGRGFEVERIALFSHGGAIHDTIATVERKND